MRIEDRNVIVEEQEDPQKLIELLQQANVGSRFNIEYETLDKEVIDSVIQLAHSNQLSIQLTYTGTDANKRAESEQSNLKLNDVLAAQYVSFTLKKIDNVLVLSLKEGDSTEEIAGMLARYAISNPIRIEGVGDPNALTNSLLSLFKTQKLRVPLITIFPPNNNVSVDNCNEKLADYHYYITRKIPLNSNDDNREPLNLAARPAGSVKIRRSKLAYQQQTRSSVQTQQQFLRQQDVATNRQQAMQRQQMAERQRQSQEQRHQERQQLIQQQINRQGQMQQVNAQKDWPGNYSDLLTRNTLKQCNIQGFTTEALTEIWDNLVGKHAAYVETASDRITHVPRETFELIVEHCEQFSDGVHFDNLPNGFQFIVKQMDDESNRQQECSILYFDPEVKKIASERVDTPLAAQLREKLPPIEDFKKVGQFYPFNEETHLVSYEAFCSEYRKDFDRVFSDESVGVEKRRKSFVALIRVDAGLEEADKVAVTALLEDWTDENLDGLRCILHTYGADTTIRFLQKVNQLPVDLREQFKRLFLDKSADWRVFIHREAGLKDELTPLSALDYLYDMPITARAWWKHLVEQHCKATPGADFCDLVNAHKHFFEQLKVIDQKLELPLECPLNVNNMKTAYDRVLYVLKKAVDPFDQVKHLALDWSMQGVICAMRPYPYVFVHEDQQLTPESGIVDWNKFRSLIPSMDPREWKPSASSPGLYWEYKRDCESKQLPSSCYAPNAFHTQDYEQRTDYHKFLEDGLITAYMDITSRTVFGIAGLDRGPNGRLRKYIATRDETTVDYIYASNVLHVTYEDIPDEKLQDESVMTRENKLSYYIALSKLQEMTQILFNYENTQPYFYRYIGTQPYAFSLEQYRHLLSLISNADQIDSNLKKSLLLFLAATTVGERAYKADENNVVLLTQMIADVAEYSSNYQNKEDMMVYVKGDRKPVSHAPETYYVFDKKTKTLHLFQNGVETEPEGVDGTAIFNAIKKMELESQAAYPTDSDLPYSPRSQYKLSELEQVFRNAGSKHQPLTGKLQRMNQNMIGATHKPTLSEAFILLKLPTNLEIERMIFDAVEQQGPVIYTVMANFAHQDPDEDSLYNLCQRLKFNEPAQLNQRQTILLLSSFLRIEDAAIFLENASTQLGSLDNDYVFTYLLELLEKADFTTHTGNMASKEQIEELIRELSLIKASDEGVKASVHKSVVAAFPSFKFSDVAVSSEIADLIRFFGQCEGLLGEFKQAILSCVPKRLPDELTDVIGAIASKMNEKVQPVSDSLTQIWKRADKAQIPEALANLKALLMFSMNPGGEIQFKQSDEISKAVEELMPAISTKLLEAIRTDLLVPALVALEKANQQDNSAVPLVLAGTIKKIKEICYQKVRTPFDVLDKWLRNPDLKELDGVVEHFNKLLQFSVDPIQEIEKDLNAIEKIGFGFAKSMMNEEIRKLREDPTIEPPIAGLTKTIEDALTLLVGIKSNSLIDKVKDKLLDKLEIVEEALKGIQNKASPSQEELNVTLNSFQQLFLFTEKPFEEIESDSFAEKTQLLALRFIVTPLIKKFRDMALDEFTGPWYNGVMAEVAKTVESLNLNDALLNAEGEEQDLLSSKFQTFLADQIPALDKDNLVISINDILSASKQAHDFLKTFEKWENRTARDLLARALYRHGYFQTKPLSPSLEQVSKLVMALKDWGDFITPELLKEVLITKENFNEIRIDHVYEVLNSLRNDKSELTQEQFNRLLEIGLHPEYKKDAVEHLLAIKKSLHGKQRGEIVFRMLLEASSNGTVSAEILAKIKRCLQTWSNEPEAVIALIEWAQKGYDGSLNGIEPLLDYFSGDSTEEKRRLLRILKHSCWEHALEADQKAIVSIQRGLIDKIAGRAASQQNQLFALYKTPPSPGISALSNILDEDDDEALEAWIQTNELDPLGAFDRIKSQFDPLGVKTFISEIVSLQDGKNLSPEEQNKLEKDYLTILNITHHFCVPVSNAVDAQVKPLREFTHQELLDYYNSCVESGKKVEALAVLCLAIFRTTGKYPYFSQIISALTTIQPTNILLEIPTGQGKGITNALNAALAHSFGKNHVSVTTKNRLLALRDFKELKGFYEYLALPVQFVLANTEQNHFEQPTIKYSTVPDESLYRSRLKMTDKVTFPNKKNQIHIGDESDSEFYDSKHAFNYSDSNEDPYHNPLKWIYSLVNEFTDLPLFSSNQVTEADDIHYFRAFLKSRDPENFETFGQLLTDSKLDELLDASCSAKGLLENEDFLVRSIERDEYGTKKLISKANILVDHAEDPDATFSYGVQQCLHAILNQTYQSEIESGERAAFSCDNQIDSVDSQFYYSYFKQFGRLICSTATAGSPEELTEVKQTLNFQTMLSIPKRKRGLLNHLDTIFTDDDTSCFFSSETQQDAIIRKLDESRERPVLLKLKNIEIADEYFSKLKTRYGNKVQVIHAGVAEDQDKFEDAVNKAGANGMITVVTPLVGRGVDIKTTLNLLVIETEVERVRSGRQYQGRTARDDNPGEVINILNLVDIETTHGSITNLSRKQKIQKLREITQGLDRNAQIDRVFTTTALAWKNRYATWLDEQSVAQNHRAEWLEIKRDFLLSADKLWQEVLADSKEMQLIGAQNNMRGCVDTYKTRLEARINQLVTDKNLNSPEELASDYLYSYNPKEELLTGRTEEPSNLVSSSEPLYPTHTVYKAYLKNTLLPENKENKAFALYYTTCHAVQNLCTKLMNDLSQGASLKKPAFISEVESFSNTLQRSYPESKMTAAEKIVQALLSAQGATAELCYLVHDHMQGDITFSLADDQDEKPLVDGVMKFITTRLQKELLRVDVKNQVYLDALCEFLEGQKPTSLLEMQYLLIPVLNRLSERVPDVALIAKALKAVVDEMASLVNAKPLTDEKRNEIKAGIIRQEILSFLTETEERLSGKWYQIGKEHAAEKIQEIHNVRETLKIQVLGDKPFDPLAEKLKPILQMNTRTGELDDEKTESWIAYKNLETRLSEELTNNESAISKKLETHLNGIRDRLVSRGEQAKKNSFFKNSALYDQKIAKLDQYQEELLKAVRQKEAKGIYDFDTEIQAFQRRVQHDPELNQSSSRFLKIFNNVTVVKEINEMTKERNTFRQ